MPGLSDLLARPGLATLQGRAPQGRGGDLASMGRRGDTMLAHISPLEAMILRSLGGAGTRNPQTGLREYYTGAFGGAEKEGKAHGGSGGSGAGRGAEKGGGVKGGGGGSGMSGAMGRGRVGGGGPVGENAAMGMTAKATPGLNIGGPLGAIGTGIGLAAAPLTGGLSSGLGKLGGLLDKAFGLGDIEIGGQSVTQARDQGYGGGTPSLGGTGIGRGNGGPGRGDRMGIRNPAPATAPAPNPLTPPAPIGIPGGLANDLTGLTPQQQRALIATYATQGINPAYRSSDTLNYYKHLLQQGMIQNGQLGDFSGVLPVENQYLQTIFGLQYQPNTPDLFRALGIKTT